MIASSNLDRELAKLAPIPLSDIPSMRQHDWDKVIVVIKSIPPDHALMVPAEIVNISVLRHKFNIFVKQGLLPSTFFVGQRTIGSKRYSIIVNSSSKRGMSLGEEVR